MATKTIAIIGADGNAGAVIAKRLAGSRYRLLLLGEDAIQLNAVFEAVKKINVASDVECEGCQVDACWEADIVILAVAHQIEKEVAEKIKNVTMGKIIISMSNPLHQANANASGGEKLQELLPSSKVVKTFNPLLAGLNSDEIEDDIQAQVFVAGNDEEALESVSCLISAAGFAPVIAGDLSVSKGFERTRSLLARVKSNIQKQLNEH